MTASLLNAWLYSYSDEGFKDFLKVLNREPTTPNKAMLDGIQFENMVSAWNKGFPAEQTHKWFNCIKTCADILKGSQEQVKVYKDYKCDGGSMNGKIDAGCMMNELFGVMMDLGKQALTSLLSNKGKGELSADELQQRNLMKSFLLISLMQIMIFLVFC